MDPFWTKPAKKNFTFNSVGKKHLSLLSNGKKGLFWANPQKQAFQYQQYGQKTFVPYN